MKLKPTKYTVFLPIWRKNVVRIYVLSYRLDEICIFWRHSSPILHQLYITRLVVFFNHVSRNLPVMHNLQFIYLKKNPFLDISLHYTYYPGQYILNLIYLSKCLLFFAVLVGWSTYRRYRWMNADLWKHYMQPASSFKVIGYLWSKIRYLPTIFLLAWPRDPSQNTHRFYIGKIRNLIGPDF